METHFTVLIFKIVEEQNHYIEIETIKITNNAVESDLQFIYYYLHKYCLFSTMRTYLKITSYIYLNK